MKYAGIAILGLLACASAKWQTVDEAGLRGALDANERTLVAYISTEDKSLKAFEKEWASFQNSDEESTAIAVDCFTNQGLCRQHDVISFPTIRFHRRDRQVERYRGPRKAKSIAAYLQRMSRPSISKLDVKNASSFSLIDDVVITAHVNAESTSLQERFTEVAEQYHDQYSFAIHQEALHGISLDCTNNVNFEQLSVTELSDPQAIDNFVKQCARPLIPEFTRRNEIEYSMLGKSIVHYFSASDMDRESYITAIRPLAKRYKEYLLFVTTDVTEYPDILSVAGHIAGSRNVLSVTNPLNGAVFPFGGKDLTSATIEGFLKDISSGKVKAWDGILPEPDIRHEEL